MLQSFTDLIAWKKAYKLTLDIYKASNYFPKEEIYSLTNQLRRAAISVSSNIAEGFSRISRKEKIQFLYTALGSLTEVQNLLMLSHDLQYLSSSKFNELNELIIEVIKLINGFIRSLKTQTNS